MENKKLFEQYYSRLRAEGVLKALFCGAIAGFAVAFVSSFVCWLFAFDGLWIALGACALAIAVSTPIFYLKRFRPTTKSIARRIDRLGLEERMITMAELEKDESYIALRQREDAKAKLATVNAKNIKFQLSRALMTAAAVVMVFAISMTTISTLTAHGVIEPLPDIKDLPIFGGGENQEEFLEVIYIAEEGGHIEGNAEQVVARGENAETVVAVADDGWMFAGWDDELEDPSRTEVDVQENMTFTATFQRVEQGGQQQQGPSEGDGDGDEGEPGDGPSNSQSPTPGPKGDGAGGKFEDHNGIIDGKTYYRDVYEHYYEEAMERLANGEDLTPEERRIIEAYYGIIE